MKTRFLPVVFIVSFLLPVPHLRAASDVAVSAAATSGGSFGGGNPNVFTPTPSAAVANQTTIQTSLNAASAVTIDTASGARSPESPAKKVGRTTRNRTCSQ